MKIRFVSVIAVFAACGGCSKLASMKSTVQNSTAALQCKIPQQVARLQSYPVQTACENALNYACQSQSFGADAAPTQGAQEQCADVSGLGHVCMNVDTTSFITAANSDSYTVYHCANIEVSIPGSYLFQSDAASLDQALASVVTKCRTGSM